MFYADRCCQYTESHEGGKHTYTFTGPCVITGRSYSVTVPGEGLYKYRQGEFIQDAFPDLPKDDREFLMSGLSPEGWAIAFPPELDDDNGEYDDEDLDS